MWFVKVKMGAITNSEAKDCVFEYDECMRCAGP